MFGRGNWWLINYQNNTTTSYLHNMIITYLNQPATFKVVIL